MISRRKAWKIQEDRTMIKLIVGTKGSGKTKAMIDQINDAVKTRCCRNDQPAWLEWKKTA